MLIGILAAVFAALAYGTASVLQARGAQSVEDAGAPGEAPSLRSTITAMLTVSFLAGTALDGIGFLGNMVAARMIPLFLAQPIVSANLVVTVVLATLFLHARLSVRDWTAIAVVVVSLVLLGFSAGDEGHEHEWWLHWAVLVVGAAILGLGAAILPRMQSRVAVLAGLSAGVLFGVLAVAVRILDGLDPFDLGELLTDPALYAIILCGPGGFYMFTVALQKGSVSAASAALVVGETVVPGVIGILVLGDTTRAGWGAVAVIAFVAAVAGAVVVAMSPVVEAVERAGENPVPDATSGGASGQSDPKAKRKTP
ncbi:DMT family transporter [Gordonia sp. SMJS1]|uniref:DMT family transporter n=1 Tax=Gordonia sp. SMJS1 TaxID=3039400 RepID=UPI00245655BE|nr:DMT family transporter [Gordonia sp. SMJS1]WGJ85867.1 DMT family transporter [Gordonia sp. SMJS1]